MDRYKFRGLRVDNGEWVYGYYAKEPDGKHCILKRPDDDDVHPEMDWLYEFQVHNETVGQYTGLKDKNGAEIYEGDVLKMNYKGVKKATVTWLDGHFAACGILGAGDYDGSEVEVIGTIHDNKTN